MALYTQTLTDKYITISKMYILSSFMLLFLELDCPLLTMLLFYWKTWNEHSSEYFCLC